MSNGPPAALSLASDNISTELPTDYVDELGAIYTVAARHETIPLPLPPTEKTISFPSLDSIMATADDPSALYRFFVREKLNPEHPETPRPIFATRVHLTGDEADKRFEVIERIEHTRLPKQISAELRRSMFD